MGCNEGLEFRVFRMDGFGLEGQGLGFLRKSCRSGTVAFGRLGGGGGGEGYLLVLERRTWQKPATGEAFQEGEEGGQERQGCCPETGSSWLPSFGKSHVKP